MRSVLDAMSDVMPQAESSGRRRYLLGYRRFIALVNLETMVEWVVELECKGRAERGHLKVGQHYAST